MFTGLVEHVGTIESFERSDLGARIRVNAGPLTDGLAKSGSIAVNGCCLTAVEISGREFRRRSFRRDAPADKPRRNASPARTSIWSGR